MDAFLLEIEEWVDRQRSKIRADVPHDDVMPLAYTARNATHPSRGREGSKPYQAGQVRLHLYLLGSFIGPGGDTRWHATTGSNRSPDPLG